ncbi:hypothetical protein M8J75_016644 [Diaphorina citri]|nr:hypothetical protein M8J75_016644 [Diaphorina citri]
MLCLFSWFVTVIIAPGVPRGVLQHRVVGPTVNPQPGGPVHCNPMADVVFEFTTLAHFISAIPTEEEFPSCTPRKYCTTLG